MQNIEYVDLSDQLAPILSKRRITYNNECHELCSEEASKIWQLPCNKYGVVMDNVESIVYGTNYNCRADLKMARGGNNLWMFATSIMLPNQGHSFPLSVFDKKGYKTKRDAIRAGIMELQNYLTAVIENDSPKSDKEASKKLLQELSSSQQEQMNLF